MLKLALTPAVAPVFPPPNPLPLPPVAPVVNTAQALDVLAHRVARNREIAGVHYGMDSLAGQCAALVCVNRLSTLPTTTPGSFQALLGAATGELAFLA